MVVTEVRPTTGIDQLAVQALQTRLLGEVILPETAEYDTARQTHNLGVNAYPSLIVRAADAGDVVRAVEFARARDLPLAVRSGGHSLAGHSSVDHSLVIDLSRMKAVSVDPVRQTAWAQPGATSGDLFAATSPYGLGLSTGDTHTVGIGGLTLGGGIGWMVRKQGLTIDNLLSAEIVTADGRILVASHDQHPELFWAIRGGGGNFGVITGFEYKLHPVGTVLGGALILPATPEVLRGYADYTPHAPDELTTITFMMAAPPAPFIPEEAVGQLVVMILATWVGDPEEGERALEPLRALATPIADTVAPIPYSGMFAYTEIGATPHAATVRSGYMHELSDEDIDIILEHFEKHPHPVGMVQLRGLGGAFGRVPASETAFAHRDKPIFLAVIGIGGEAYDHFWSVELWNKLKDSTVGVYVNFLEQEGDDRVHEAYPPATYERLALAKRKYDPTNLFRLNQNIRPAPDWSPRI